MDTMFRSLPASRYVRRNSRLHCTLATDLKAEAYDQVDHDKQTLTIALAAPQPLQARLIHDAKEKGGSYFYATSSRGLVALSPGSSNRTKAMNNALTRAQQAVTRTCTAAPNIAAAKQQAEQVLTTLFRQAGWTPAFAWKWTAVAPEYWMRGKTERSMRPRKKKPLIRK